MESFRTGGAVLVVRSQRVRCCPRHHARSSPCRTGGRCGLAPTGGVSTQTGTPGTPRGAHRNPAVRRSARRPVGVLLWRYPALAACIRCAHTRCTRGARPGACRKLYARRDRRRHGDRGRRSETQSSHRNSRRRRRSSATPRSADVSTPPSALPSRLRSIDESRPAHRRGDSPRRAPDPACPSPASTDFTRRPPKGASALTTTADAELTSAVVRS